MSTDFNPYSAPQAYIPPPTGVSFEQAATAEYAEAVPRILEAMRRTRPWITMFSILSFIGGGLMGLGAIAVFASAASAQIGAAIGGAMFYFMLAAFYIVTGWLLWSYRQGIEGFLASGGGAGMLSIAVDRQASFWKFVGILTLVMMVLYAILGLAMLTFMSSKMF
jgi:hypothetical protein